jgi:hypothetical protein
MPMKTKQASVGAPAAVVAMLVVAGLGAAVPAGAVEHGVYMAADYGNTRFGRTAASFDTQLEPFLESGFCADLSCSNAPDAVFDQTSLTRKAHGYDAWVGYQFSPWFAVEGAYLILGSTRHHFTGTMDEGPVDVDNDGNVDYSGPQPIQGDTKFRTRGPAVAAVGSLALGNYFSVDARAGLFFADDRLSLGIQYSPENQPVENYSYSQSNGRTKLFYGATANFWITPYFGVRAGYTGSSDASFGHSVKYYFLGFRYSYGY